MEPHTARKPSDHRPVRLHLVYTSVWSVAKVSLLAGLILAVVTAVSGLILWTVLDQSGVLNQLDSILSGPAPADAASTASVKKIVNPGTVILMSSALGLLGAIFTMVVGAIVALLYNVSARFTGGLFVGFQRD
ncbi:DUF3566 domain-containing protein [Leifsonia sp. NPDC014704]|jgi:hypothetical protein|uniref:DUF3566 domain-containing protein n=1 Tax=unclassified Leifsonia TaxID=2663824 RepID=UPI000A197BFE|nr:DUF3566 domain-containing protein [Leifsonia sp. NCR5]